LCYDLNSQKRVRFIDMPQPMEEKMAIKICIKDGKIIAVCGCGAKEKYDFEKAPKRKPRKVYINVVKKQLALEVMETPEQIWVQGGTLVKKHEISRCGLRTHHRKPFLRKNRRETIRGMVAI
jgi:hypothetical protein